MKIEEIKSSGFERTILGVDDNSGFFSYIAVHNTNLGPALGGCRYYDYESECSQYVDTLKLAEGMTYKNALANLEWGGGKATIQAIPKTEEVWEMFAELVNYLEGSYYTSGDVGTTTEDMQVISKYTDYIVYGRKDSGVATAYGLFNSILALLEFLDQTQKLPIIKTLAIQGLGKVGIRLLEFCSYMYLQDSIDKSLLRKYCPTSFIVSDVDQKKTNEIVKRYQKLVNIVSVPPEEIHKVECDVFVPCAIGGIINHYTVLELGCKGICGGANNQLAYNNADSRRLLVNQLKEHDIWYVPDYLANSGGVIIVKKMTGGGFVDLEYNDSTVNNKLKNIYGLTKKILYQSLELDRFTTDICDEIAKERFNNI